LSRSPASNKPTLKVPYHELRAFKECKLIIQFEWEVQLSQDKLVEWLILALGLSQTQIHTEIKYYI